MSSSKVEHPKVAFQGINGSFSYLAMQEYFEGKASGLGQSNFRGIFSTLGQGLADYALVPIENSLAGAVYDIYDLLFEFDFQVIGEHYHRVNHALLVTNGFDITKDTKGLKRVFSHPKALEQCQDFFDENPDAERISFSDTASAAKYVAELKEPTFAAIASKESARLYGLKVLKDNIEDNQHNYTRFLALSREPGETKDADKTSLIFSLPHKPQSLFKAMEAISDDRINISKIQSRPIHGKPFEYLFYVDFDFDSTNLDFVQEKLKAFKERVNFFKSLGVYKKSSIT